MSWWAILLLVLFGVAVGVVLAYVLFAIYLIKNFNW